MHIQFIIKQCVKCKKDLPTKDFYPLKRSKDGLHRYCKQCCKVNRSLEAVRKRDKSSKVSYRQRYRAHQLGIECDDSITLAQVFNRDLGVCGICNEWVQPKKASMDHKIPVVRGGTHTMENLQLTHIICTLRS